jgi:hypothetical protein
MRNGVPPKALICQGSRREFEPCISQGSELSQVADERDSPQLARIGSIGQWWRTRRAGPGPEGTATTMTQSASIANPMNSNTKASTAISPNKAVRFVAGGLTVP